MSKKKATKQTAAKKTAKKAAAAKKTAAKKTTKHAQKKKPQPRKKREPRHESFTETILNILSCGNVVEDLAEEMGDWRDNLESNNMEHLPKYEEVSEAADTLENSGQSIEDAASELQAALEQAKELRGELVNAIQVTYTLRSRRGSPRWLRRDNALAPLHAVVEKLNRLIEDAADEKDLAEGKADAINNIRDQVSTLEDALTEASEVNFPGMFG